MKTYYCAKYAVLGISARQARAPGLVGIGFISQNFNAFEEGGAKNGMGKLLVCRLDVP